MSLAEAQQGSAARPALPVAATAMRLVSPRRFEPVEVPLRSPGEGEVMIRVAGCGVCASNVPPWEGRDWFEYPMEPGSPGHEGWGQVLAAGERVKVPAVGDRVGFLCEQAFATHVVTPASRCVVLPRELSRGAFPAEPLACAMNVASRAQMHPGQLVAVVGVGFLGNLLIRLAAAQGVWVLAIARREASLEQAKAAGAAATLCVRDAGEAVRAVSEASDGQLCDCVIECAGNQVALDVAGELVRIRGRLVIAGYHQDGLRTVNMQSWNWRGIDVINAHEREEAVYMRGMREAVKAVTQGVIDPEPLCTHRFALGELNEALEMASSRPGGFVKAVMVSQA